MARNVQAIAQAEWFAPDIGDNRTDPDPFEALVQPLSVPTMRALQQASLTDLTTSDAQNLGKTIDDRSWRLKLLAIEEGVIDGRGYSVVRPDGTVDAPKIGKEWVATILQPWVPAEELSVLERLFEACVSRSTLAEGARKK